MMLGMRAMLMMLIMTRNYYRTTRIVDYHTQFVSAAD